MALLRHGLLSPALLFYLVFFIYAYGTHVMAAKNTVYFNITLTWDDWQPAGIPRKMILANGQFPAPTMKLKQGDDVEFLVTNELPFATTVHFHGIEQHDTPWSDGVPGLSQAPIPSGGSFLYKWRATNPGNHMYHAHKRGQQEDGLYGAIYILPDSSIVKPFSLISDGPDELRAIEVAESKSSPIILSDVRQLTSEEIWQVEIDTGRDTICANALLVNGKGTVTCLEQEVIDQFTSVPQKGLLGNGSLTDIGCLPPDNVIVQGDYPHNLSAIPPSVFSGCTPSAGLTERLYADADGLYVSYNLISAATISELNFSIDEHPLYVYAVDGHYIEPILVDALIITNGARYSVLVKLDKPRGDYTIRVANVGVNQILHGTALLTYHNGGGPVQQQPSVPSFGITGVPVSPEYVVLNESTVIPFPPQDVSDVPVAQTIVLTVGRYDQSYTWTLGNSSYPLALEETLPLLFYPDTAPKDLAVSTRNGTWVDVVFDVANALQPPHPIHKHSNKFFVIGQGEGKWNYSSVAEALQHIPGSFNLQAPQIRDTFITPPAATGPTWLAVRYHVVNPGAFLFHCHIQIHHSGGMALAVLDGIDEWPEIPEEFWLAEEAH
ncbi:Cupredoxin [Aspergillus karnatakaensis]|uniref:Cupredoxin n=1 Tax=Aspergillus karnatakaensis TaxID=1810916 RepID=UPI003CCD09A9